MVPYIDMHCDTLMKAWLKRSKSVYQLKGTMVDVSRLHTFGCKAQFFAVFLLPIKLKKYLGPLFPKDGRYINDLISIFQNTLQKHPDIFAPALTSGDLARNAAAGKISGILTMEDGRAIDSKIENLDRFYEMGIRVLGLTWNQPNCFGEPNSTVPEIMAAGLTSFGKDAVVHMNELGMGIDVSHLSDGGFWDVAKISQKPFFATHSNCRSINPHPRSLSDEMIRALAEKGGIMGVNFGPHFLTSDLKGKDSTVQMIAAQLRQMVNVGGIDCAAIGSDFDGISGNLEICSAEKMPALFDVLQHTGFTSSEIDKIAHENVERVLKDVLG